MKSKLKKNYLIFKLNRVISYESKHQSIKLIQNNNLLQGKLDLSIDENKELKLEPDDIQSKSGQIFYSQIKDQSDLVLQNKNVSSQ